MTERFVSAAEMMSRVLGMPGYAFVVIDHPVSSATDGQLSDRARQAIDQGLKMLVKDPAILEGTGDGPTR